MNDRIKQLMLEAGYAAPEIAVRAQKFAELIVKECADVMDGRDENGNAKDGQYLLTKFGIDASQRYT